MRLEHNDLWFTNIMFMENGRRTLKENESKKWNEKEAVKLQRNEVEGLHNRKMCRPSVVKFSVCKTSVLWYNDTETESEEI